MLHSLMASSNLKTTVSLFVLCCIVCLSSVNACYITNCPWGGKRSLGGSNQLDETHQCRTCANGLGTCFGPRICCGSEIGCLLDTQASLPCRAEDTRSTVPCAPYGKPCGKVEYGRCATKNLCCSPDACVHDASCGDEEEQVASGERLSDEDRQLLKAILLSQKHHN